ncbi:unnamed protein product [Vitrella brassicaformis CCMP3155]|uniref:Ubiquitin-like domain-containing protein n=1 Tax=Vitrella brassicaformis (strain CCMP3155) TaxID=1169540 RepID=A0A0G4FU79_VITBC|nr:unnamed protein product [Vitrella brassicaformis CCMP3155]|eukprot:CEM18520.1 unnamed protein product [Vitrella brassicaformis CCMP3155]
MCQPCMFDSFPAMAGGKPSTEPSVAEARDEDPLPDKLAVLVKVVYQETGSRVATEDFKLSDDTTLGGLLREVAGRIQPIYERKGSSVTGGELKCKDDSLEDDRLKPVREVFQDLIDAGEDIIIMVEAPLVQPIETVGQPRQQLGGQRLQRNTKAMIPSRRELSALSGGRSLFSRPYRHSELRQPLLRPTQHSPGASSH